jgi:hypothetical protein
LPGLPGLSIFDESTALGFRRALAPDSAAVRLFPARAPTPLLDLAVKEPSASPTIGAELKWSSPLCGRSPGLSTFSIPALCEEGAKRLAGPIPAGPSLARRPGCPQGRRANYRDFIQTIQLQISKEWAR